MILHAQSGFRGQIIDLDTGRPVRKVIWFDTERCELEAYQIDAAGNIIRDVNGEYLTYRARGRFRFKPDSAKPLARTNVEIGAPRCLRCGNPLTLPGSDLCAFCNAKDKGYKGFKVERMTTPFLDCPCQSKGCGMLAEWSVSDEVVATPEVSGRRFWDRGALVGRRFYCSKHYVAPRLLDQKGEVVEVFEEAGGVRPQ